jgi:hypothetical protein
LAPGLPDAVKLLHITGSYPRFQNKAETRRAKEFEERTGIRYQPKRLATEEDIFDKSMAMADHCSLLGNDHTLRTFPEEYRSKLTLVTVSTSKESVKPVGDLITTKREFMWFFSGGAVIKGWTLYWKYSIPCLTSN